MKKADELFDDSFLEELKGIYYEEPLYCDRCPSQATVRNPRKRVNLCTLHYRQLSPEKAGHHSDWRRIGLI